MYCDITALIKLHSYCIAQCFFLLIPMRIGRLGSIFNHSFKVANLLPVSSRTLAFFWRIASLSCVISMLISDVSELTLWRTLHQFKCIQIRTECFASHLDGTNDRMKMLEVFWTNFIWWGRWTEIGHPPQQWWSSGPHLPTLYPFSTHGSHSNALT